MKYNFANQSLNPNTNQDLQEFYNIIQNTLTKVNPNLKLIDATNSYLDDILIHNLLITNTEPINHLLTAYIFNELFKQLETNYTIGTKIYGPNKTKAILTIYAD